MGGAKKKKRSAREGELEADEALALLEGLRQPEGLPTTTLLRLLSGHQPCCDANNTTCKGRKDNPNCLCGLVPAPGSFRKKGLWQKEPTAITNLGGDPNEQKRTVRLLDRAPRRPRASRHASRGPVV